jgi:hypothetical protein
MIAPLLSALPLFCILAAFLYAAVTGARLYRSNGFISVLGVAVTLAGLTLGRLLDRVPLPHSLDDWVNYRGPLDHQISTKGERFLAILSVEVALLFLLASAVSFLAVLVIKRDASGASRTDTRMRKAAPLVALFAFAVGIPARAKISVYLAFLLAKAHLL